jgi:hypothetical protein
MSQEEADIVKQARQAGGDALIQIRSDSQIVGYQTTASSTAVPLGNSVSTTGFATSIPLGRNRAAFAVIKYVE